jgi:ankyrin repeat protein
MSVGPLTWAAQYGRPDVALRLIKRDRQITRADRHLLYFAAAAGQWDLLMGSLPYTREVNVSNRADVTPLMLAADAGQASAVPALLAAGANVNARSVRSWPPLLETNLGAALAGHSPSPPKLAGGYTALRAAREKGHADIARMLEAAGGRE